jgi:hypothetical protein
MHDGLVRRCRWLFAASSFLLLAVRAQAAPEWDVVGIRLGMTPVQARAALLAHAPKADITEFTRQFMFSDGAKNHPTPGFLASLTARQERGPSSTETVELLFSAPPMEQRVIRVIRTVSMPSQPVAMDSVLASVVQKYGRPAATLESNNGMVSILRWLEAGKPVCGNPAASAQDAREAPPVDNSPAGLGHYRAWQQRKLAPPDPSDCSGALVVSLATLAPRGPLVKEMKLVMTHPGYAIPAMQATARRLAELEAEAKKTRRTSGAVPKL